MDRSNPMFVVHSNGRVCIQIDAGNEWGFSLIDEGGDEYPGGFGLGNGSWKSISSEDLRISDELRSVFSFLTEEA